MGRKRSDSERKRVPTTVYVDATIVNRIRDLAAETACTQAEIVYEAVAEAIVVDGTFTPNPVYALVSDPVILRVSLKPAILASVVRMSARHRISVSQLMREILDAYLCAVELGALPQPVSARIQRLEVLYNPGKADTFQ